MASYADTLVRLNSYVIAQFGTQNISPNVNRGTIFYALTASFSAQTVDAMTQIENTAAQSFLGSATGQFLTNKAADYGVYRTPPSSATGTYVFNRVTADPVKSYTQPAGTVVSTQTLPGSTPVAFVTAADATIPAGSTLSNPVTITAVVPGTTGNVGVGTVTVINSLSLGIYGGTNTTATTGGASSESDAQLLQQTLGVIQPSGSVYAIQGVALGVAGIFDSAVYDWQDGLGNYTCYACAQDGTLSGALTTSVYSAIAAVDGIGLTRHVGPFPIISQTVYANLYVLPGYTYATVATQVQTALKTYMGSLLHGTNVVPYNLQRVVDGSLGSTYPAIPGVGDFVITTPSSVVTVGSFQIARLPSGFTPGITQIFS